MQDKLFNLYTQKMDFYNIAFLLLCGDTTGTSFGRKRSGGAGQSPANIIVLEN